MKTLKDYEVELKTYCTALHMPHRKFVSAHFGNELVEKNYLVTHLELGGDSQFLQMLLEAFDRKELPYCFSLSLYKPGDAHFAFWSDDEVTVHLQFNPTPELMQLVGSEKFSFFYRKPMGWNPTGALADDDELPF